MVLFSALAFGQQSGPPPAQSHSTTTEAATLSQEQIRTLIKRAAENDMENDKKLRNYTYVQEEVSHKLDGNGKVKTTESKTSDVMMVYGEQVERLVAKNGKPLSPKEAAKEDERIQKITEKRKNESDEQRAKRLKKEEKDREETRRFVSEVADAYNFRQVGLESIGGRETYVIDGEPRPGFEPHSKEAKFLPHFRFRIWIDKADAQWVKLDAQAIDTVSIGFFLARIHQGSRIVVEQIYVNGEVWLPRHIDVKVDVRLALLKNFNVEDELSYRDYKRFRTDSKIVPIAEGQTQP